MDDAIPPAEHIKAHKSLLDHDLFKSKYFLFACAAVLISIIYWTIFSFNAYNTYHEYGDLGLFSYDMYYHVHYASIVSGLQYLIFANHIAIDQLFILPIFALFQSAMTLLIMQVLIVSITGLVIFLVSRDILKNEKVALLLCLAFLVNPGTFGMLLFDYHAEILIPPFLILTFYFYYTRRFYPFLASLLLLLGTIEISPFIALAFAVTMALYAFLREKDLIIREEWLKYSGIAVVVSFAVFLFYWLITSSLVSAYAAGQYGSLPLSLQVLQTTSQQFSAIGNGLTSYIPAPQNMSPIAYIIFALLIVFASFGIAGLFDPIFAILFASPWLFEVFVVGNHSFIYPWYQYFGFTLGGSAIIAILSLKNIMSHPDGKFDFSILQYGHKFVKYVKYSIPVFVVLLFILWPSFVYSVNVYNLGQEFLFYTNQSTLQQIQQLNSMLSTIPANATVMAPYFAMPHLFNRQYFELLPSSPDSSTILQPGSNNYAAIEANRSAYGLAQLDWFSPEYVLVDFNPVISESAREGYEVQNFVNISGLTSVNGSVEFNGAYGLYNYSGLAIVLKKN